MFTYCLRALHLLLPAQQPTQESCTTAGGGLPAQPREGSPGALKYLVLLGGEGGDHHQQVAEKRACVCGSSAVSGKDSSKCQFALLNSYLQQYRIKEM